MRKTKPIYLILIPILLLGMAGCTAVSQSIVTAPPPPTLTATPFVPPTEPATPASTATYLSARPLTATPEVLSNGNYQWRLSAAGLTLSAPPGILRSWEVDELHAGDQSVTLRFKLRNAAFTVFSYPRNGYSLETIARSPHLAMGFYGPTDPTPTPEAALRMNEVLVGGRPALRLVLGDTDLRVGAVWVQHGDVVLYAVAWGGEGEGDLLYTPSERSQVRAWFDQIIGTFAFSD